MTKPQDLANAIRALSMDAVERAQSGHPGAPLGMADIAEVLWNKYLKHNPLNPKWYDRDRFILSNGHGSMLIYSLLHLSGYDLSIEDLKNFRQLDSKTPGHPEYGYTQGVETTTGPLGQGLANAVGMAISEKTLSAQFNREEFEVVDHYTYVFLGDGCMMEGISHEACSLAGTLGLGKLVAFYDDNGISIDGDVSGWFTDDTVKRFESYGWHVIKNIDGHNLQEIDFAISAARSETKKPTLICCKTVIGYGSPNKAGSEKSHGAPLGKDEIQLTKQNLGWNYPPFVIPDAIYKEWSACEKGSAFEKEWTQRFAAYEAKYPELASEFKRRMEHETPSNFSEQASRYIDECQKKCTTTASRKSSQSTLNQYGPLLPELLGGSADLAGSNLTLWKDSKGVSSENASGNYIFYGVREFAMTAIMNGIALHGGFIPYGATFLVFSDYARNAVRMSALMKQKVIHVYTHDSIGLGEDGPTHQPIEHLSSLRLIPGLDVWRPCDETETAVAWKYAIENNNGPSVLVFSRQNLAGQIRDKNTIQNIYKGGYVLIDSLKSPDLILIATGSEVQLAVEAQKVLAEKGYNIRVVSMPCTSVFDVQLDEYKENVLGSIEIKKLAIEAGHKDYWYKYVGLHGQIIGMDTYGESAPATDLFKMFGFTVENIVNKAITMLN